MAKSIKLLAPEIYYIKAMMPTWDHEMEGMSEESPYRIIALNAFTPLDALGHTVLNAFDFDNDHLFGFYDNWKKYYASKVAYEHPSSIDFMDDDFGDKGKQLLSMNDYEVQDIFTRRGKKWLMLFDYGDEWHFWLSLVKKVPFDDSQSYPFLVESKYEAPEQYPAYEDDFE